MKTKAKKAIIVKRKEKYFIYDGPMTKKLGGPFISKDMAEKFLQKIENLKNNNKEYEVVVRGETFKFDNSADMAAFRARMLGLGRKFTNKK